MHTLSSTNEQKLGAVKRAIFQRNLVFGKLSEARNKITALRREITKMERRERFTNTNEYRENEARDPRKPAKRPEAPVKQDPLNDSLTHLDMSRVDRVMYTEDNRICFFLKEESQRWYYGLGSLHMNVLADALRLLDESDGNAPIHTVVNTLKQRHGEKQLLEVFRHATRDFAKGNLDWNSKKVEKKTVAETHGAKGGVPRGW